MASLPYTGEIWISDSISGEGTLPSSTTTCRQIQSSSRHEGMLENICWKDTQTQENDPRGSRIKQISSVNFHGQCSATVKSCLVSSVIVLHFNMELLAFLRTLSLKLDGVTFWDSRKALKRKNRCHIKQILKIPSFWAGKYDIGMLNPFFL